MGRKLPWLQDKVSTKSPRPTASKTREILRPTKRARTQSLSPMSSATSESSGYSTPAAHNPRRTELQRSDRPRSSSNSPPPSPPPMDLMQPGLDADDIYVMVEDEFQAVAQSYTQHLHHAEYKRLKTNAKERHAEDIKMISRPTTNSGSMSKERQMIKEQQKLVQRQDRGLEKIGAKERRKDKIGKSHEGDNDNDPEIVRDDDDWVGTALGSLMSGRGNSNTSLVGLQGIPSNTKAAMGFKRPEKKVDTSEKYDLKLSLGKANIKHFKEVGTGDNETTTDSDDLDRKPIIRKLNHPSSSEQKNLKVSILDPKSKTQGAQTEDSLPNQVSPHKRLGTKGILKKSRPVEVDLFDDDMKPTPLLPSVRRRNKQNQTKVKDHEGNDIPIFLA